MSRIVLVPGRWRKRRPWLVGNAGDLDLDLARERCRVVEAEGVPRAGVSGHCGGHGGRRTRWRR